MDLLQELSQLWAEFDTLSSQSQELDSRTDKTLRNLQKMADDSNRVADVAHNASEIFDDLDREFEQVTKLNGLDITFMFLAIAVQCARRYILNSLRFKINVRNMAITEQPPTTAAFSKAFQAIQSDKMNLPTQSFNDMIRGEEYNFE